MRNSASFVTRYSTTLLILLGCGCATVIVPQRVELQSLKLGTNCAAVIDKRSAEERGYRESGGMGGSKYLADETLKPRAVELLACELTASLPTQYRDAPIEITRCEVGYFISIKHRGSSGSPYVPSGIPPGPAIIGALLGGGIVAMLQRATADESAFVSIELTVSGKELRAMQMVGINRERSANQAIEEALRAALAEIATQAGGLGSQPEQEVKSEPAM